MITHIPNKCKHFFNIYKKFFCRKNTPEASSIKASGVLTVLFPVISIYAVLHKNSTHILWFMTIDKKPFF